jgi:hypothetical protein
VKKSSNPSGGSNTQPFVLGTSASVGCGIPTLCGAATQFSGSYSRTIDSLADLDGPANSINVNLRQGSFSHQEDEQGNVSYGLAFKGLGTGASVSQYQTQTKTFASLKTSTVVNAATAAYQSAIMQIQSKIDYLKAEVRKLSTPIKN